MIDTHVHLDYLKAPLDEVLSSSRAYGVTRLITVAVDPENLDVTLKLARDHAQVWCTQGVHPHDAKHVTPEVMAHIRQNALDPTCVAIGEIGLDYHYDHSAREIQRRVFEEQLALAIELQKPVVIHSREAEDDTIAILKNVRCRGVFHSFSSELRLAEWALAQGYDLGFNGMITFPKADNVRSALRMTPVDRVHVETDAPYLAPVPHRGKENSPAFIPAIVERMAMELNIPVGTLKAKLDGNADRLFSISR